MIAGVIVWIAKLVDVLVFVVYDTPPNVSTTVDVPINIDFCRASAASRSSLNSKRLNRVLSTPGTTILIRLCREALQYPRKQ